MTKSNPKKKPYPLTIYSIQTIQPVQADVAATGVCPDYARCTPSTALFLAIQSRIKPTGGERRLIYLAVWRHPGLEDLRRSSRKSSSRRVT